MGEVVSLADRRAALRPVAPAPVDELAEIVVWLKPASSWWKGKLQIELANSFRHVADVRRILAADEHGKDSEEYASQKDLADKAFDAWRVVCLRQVFIPAPNVAALRWKQDWVRRNNGAGCSEIALAIAQDERALAGRLAAVAKQQAGRKKHARQH